MAAWISAHQSQVVRGGVAWRGRAGQAALRRRELFVLGLVASLGGISHRWTQMNPDIGFLVVRSVFIRVHPWLKKIDVGRGTMEPRWP